MQLFSRRKTKWSRKDTIALIGWILVAQAAGIIGSLFTAPAVADWYPTLAKPALTPPSWVFAPVWTTLFVLMGIAAFLVWRNGTKKQAIRAALALFMLQLVLNILWSVLFFGLQRPGAALLEIIVLWLAIAATIVAFYRISKPAAYLLLPYILWVSFAVYLNAAIWGLN